jgi:hypothetical protein
VVSDEFGAGSQSERVRPSRDDHDQEDVQLRHEDDTGFPKLSAPARRALSAAGYTHLGQLDRVSESELSQLHGVGRQRSWRCARPSRSAVCHSAAEFFERSIWPS